MDSNWKLNRTRRIKIKIACIHSIRFFFYFLRFASLSFNIFDKTTIAIGNGHHSTYTYAYNTYPIQRPTSSGIIEARNWYDTFWFIDYVMYGKTGRLELLTFCTGFRSIEWFFNGPSAYFALFCHYKCWNHYLSIRKMTTHLSEIHAIFVQHAYSPFPTFPSFFFGTRHNMTSILAQTSSSILTRVSI